MRARVCACVIQSERGAGGGVGRGLGKRISFFVSSISFAEVTAVTTATHNRQLCLWLNHGPAHAQALASS